MNKTPCKLTELPLLKSRFIRSFEVCFWGLLFYCLTLGRVSGFSTTDDFFETEVRPLLAEHCWECHGDQKQWNSLRLDSYESMKQGGDSGPVIVPGSPEQSLLYQAVSRKGDLEMPPENPLNEKQIAILRKWIELGAHWPSAPESPPRGDAWKSHWAFQALSRKLPPEFECDGNISANPVDSFVAQKLCEVDLEPAPPADRRTLIRRVTYALTGLPPTYEEVERFVNDIQPDAYARLVDRLLSSPSFGQHLARTWLDVARYSDAKGYVYAREERFYVHSATYRDWVVEAMNSDLPYDQFIRLQIAADQIAPDHPPSLAAMGLLTLGRRFLGVTHDIIDDRIDVICRGVMGLTVGCARCHDHKYDPIPTSDYYSLYGVFQCSTDRQVDLAEYQNELHQTDEFRAELDKRVKALADKTASSHQEAADRVRSRVADYLFAQSELEKYPEEGFDVVLAVTDLIPAFVRRWESFLSSRRESQDPVFHAWFQFSSLPADHFAQGSEQISRQLRNRAHPNWELHPWVAELFQTAPVDLRHVADLYGKLFSEVDSKWKSVSSNKQTDWSVQEATWVADAQPILDVLYGSTAPCEVPDEEIIATETFFDSGTCNELWKLQGEVDRWRLQSAHSPAVAVALFDRASLSNARILKRGNPANKGPRVPRHFLSMFASGQPAPFEIGSGRVELAERITDQSNPLTPRVWVNRLWQHCFGEGLVRTTSDFGLRAQPPSHPELLDWLALQLIEQGWSTKAILHTIVLSSIFQQASRIPVAHSDSGLPAVNAEVINAEVINADFARASEIDPEHQLLWRFAPRRLRFEELRDSWLMVSGSLDDSPGGKATEMFTSEDSHHRRSLYGLVDRQFLPGTLRVFDFANPDLHIGRRSETLVPQQALYCLNHPFLVHRARSLIGGMQQAQPAIPLDQPSSQATAIQWLYRRVFQRDPSQQEHLAALHFLRQADNDPENSMSAWEQLAQVLMMTNEFTFVD